MPSPKPVTITSGANPTPGVAPQEFVAVGGLPAPSNAQVAAALKAKTQIAALTANSAADAAAAAGTWPTKEEYDAVVALANSLKVTLNAVIAALKA